MMGCGLSYAAWYRYIVCREHTGIIFLGQGLCSVVRAGAMAKLEEGTSAAEVHEI
jgi:hypothetical protein